MTIWIRHPSGLTIHLIEGTPDFRLCEGPNRDASTGERSKRPFTHDVLDPAHLRRGHHLAFDISDMEALKATLDKVLREPSLTGLRTGLGVIRSESSRGSGPASVLLLLQEGIPYHVNHIPGSTTGQIWFADVEVGAIHLHVPDTPLPIRRLISWPVCGCGCRGTASKESTIRHPLRLRRRAERAGVEDPVYQRGGRAIVCRVVLGRSQGQIM